MAEVGRPRLFNSEEELQGKIDQYYIHIQGEFHMEDVTINLKGGTTVEKKEKVWDRMPQTPSITGLALFLGFESRQSIYDYEKNGEFSYSIKKAKLQVEASYEQFLLTQSCTGAIFALKNFGWRDTTTLANDENNPIKTSNLSDEDLMTVISLSRKASADNS